MSLIGLSIGATETGPIPQLLPLLTPQSLTNPLAVVSRNPALMRSLAEDSPQAMPADALSQKFANNPNFVHGVG